jgi:diacylglycerol kinase
MNGFVQWAFGFVSTDSVESVIFRCVAAVGGTLMVDWPPVEETNEIAPAPRPKRRWSQKFADALRGLKLGIRGHSSFFVHFFAAALVVAVAFALGCSLEQWGLLLLCIGFVLTAELFNSAIETLHRGLDPETRERSFKALDIAAGAVFMASATAAFVGALVFLGRILQMLGWIT